MTARTIIGLTGRAGSGKDTAAQALIEHRGFHRFALADEVKKAALLIDPLITPQSVWGRESCWQQLESIDPTMSDRDEPERLSWMVGMIGWDAAKQIPEVRRLLQTIGTEAGWQLHGQDLWTTRVQHQVEALPADQNIVITDIRMPHELAWLRTIGGSLATILRSEHDSMLGTAQRNHISEAGPGEAELEVFSNDRILNNGSIETLQSTMLHVADRLAWTK